MKILVIAPASFFSDQGAHIRILEESLALEKLGHAVTIATYDIGTDIDIYVDTKIKVRRIKRLFFWHKKSGAESNLQKLFLDSMLSCKALRLAFTEKPDVIHGHSHEGALIGWIVKKVLFWQKMVLVADFHGSLESEAVLHGYFFKKIFAKMEKWIINLADNVITSSDELTSELTKFRKNSPARTVLDGVNLENYEKLPTKIELKKELELPLEKTIVTYVGTLANDKGVEYLMDAIAEVLRLDKNMYFVVAGFPVGDVLEFVKLNDLSLSVRVISPLNYFDLPKILMASDIGINPADYENLQISRKVLQYMAASLPVACFDLKNNLKYLGEGGQYAREISASGLAQGILRLAGEPQKMIFKGQLNRQQVNKFSWDTPAKQIEQIYLNQN